jgi:hypothetical protein
MNGAGQTATCTLTASIVTNYQNDPERNLAGWSITNSPGCRDASLVEQITWTSPVGGSMSYSAGYGDIGVPIPSQAQEAYSPVHTSPAQAQFTEFVQVAFNDCINNCDMALQLTADGKA